MDCLTALINQRSMHVGMARSAALIVLITCSLAGTQPSSAHAFPQPASATVLHAPCPDDPYIDACSYRASATEANPCGNPAGCIYLITDDRFRIWHERGHVWESQKLTDADRAWFTSRMRMRPQPWLSHRYHHPSPGEKFADLFANCALRNGWGRRAGYWETGYSYSPASIRRHRQLCTAIRILDLVREPTLPAG